MDVACFPSIYDSESFGVAAVEAMACGVPVITSDASGFTEVVTPEAGIITKKGDIDALANALTTVFKMTNEDRVKMGRAGIKRVKELYNFESNMDIYIEVLERTALSNFVDPMI